MTSLGGGLTLQISGARPDPGRPSSSSSWAGCVTTGRLSDRPPLLGYMYSLPIRYPALEEEHWRGSTGGGALGALEEEYKEEEQPRHQPNTKQSKAPQPTGWAAEGRASLKGRIAELEVLLRSAPSASGK